MKGKRKFTQKEAEQIRILIREKNRVTPGQQKTIRYKIRKLGFYYSDFSSSKEGYTIADFDALIKSGQIEIIGKKSKDSIQKISMESDSYVVRRKILPSKSHDFSALLAAFQENRFDPKLDSEIKIPGQPGNYIVCLCKGSILPSVDIIPKMKKFAGLNVVYTGIASQNLRERDYRQHFTGNNAGRSTLRKSIGSLMGLKKISRDKDPSTGKTKFTASDESKLSRWMLSNLVLYFYANKYFNRFEDELIQHFNPPLNLQGNNNSVNADFRNLLSKLRSRN